MELIDRSPANPTYHWLTTIIVMCGSFMVVLDATVVIIALPKIMADFGVNINKIQWIITAYMLTMAIMMPSVGWLSQRLGNRGLFLVSLAIFTAASVLCGTAWNINALILFRVLQGFGAGLIMPIAMAIIFEAFPVERRGMAMGIYGLGATFGPVIGPTLGGYLTEKFSWHLIFLINIPVGLVAIVLAAWILPGGTTRKGLHFDVWGFVTMAVGLGCLLMGLSQGRQEGWTSTYILGLFGVALAALAVFLRVELTSSHPFIDLRVYKNFTYTMATTVFIIQGIGLFGSTYLIPLFFETILKYSPLETGLLMLPMAVVVSITLPLSGRLTDRIDVRIPIGLGVTCAVLSLFWLSFLNMGTSSVDGIGMLIMRGFGIGFIFPPIMNSALRSLPQEKVAIGSGLMNVSRQLGGAFGVAFLGTVLEHRQFQYESIFLKAQGLASYAANSALPSVQTWSNSPGAAHQGTATLHALVAQKAMVASYDDTFLLAAGIFALAILPTILLRSRRLNSSHSGSDQPPGATP